MLFSDFILGKYPAVHRLVGKIYVGLLLLVSAPSGLVMGFHANGGWMVQMSFFILTPLWWWFTYKGYITARQRNFKIHKIWMMRSYALTLSAIILRLYQMLLGSFFVMEPIVKYILVPFLSWVANLFFIEIWIKYKSGQLFSFFSKPTIFSIKEFLHA